VHARIVIECNHPGRWEARTADADAQYCAQGATPAGALMALQWYMQREQARREGNGVAR
jgi:hypothetical protein